MTVISVLMDAAPIGGPIGVIAGVVFFLILIAIAFVAFRLLKKTVGVAIRVVVVLVIIAVAVFGSVALWMFSTGTPRSHPASSRPR